MQYSKCKSWGKVNDWEYLQITNVRFLFGTLLDHFVCHFILCYIPYLFPRFYFHFSFGIFNCIARFILFVPPFWGILRNPLESTQKATLFIFGCAVQERSIRLQERSILQIERSLWRIVRSCRRIERSYTGQPKNEEGGLLCGLP